MKKPMKCKDCGTMIPKPKANKTGRCTACGLKEANKKRYNKDSQSIKSANNLGDKE